MRLLTILRVRLAWTVALLTVMTACTQTPSPVTQAKAPPAPPARTTEAFAHPVPGARISSAFANYIVKSRNRKHHGTDFSAPVGTPVFASRSGVVLSADNTSLSGDFGYAVLIEHGEQFQSLSAHLSRLDVSMGDWVQAGQQIGLVGKTGRATGAHLHFELWQNNIPKDPLQFLPLTEAQRLAVQKPQAAIAQTTRSTSERAESVSTPSKTSKNSNTPQKNSRKDVPAIAKTKGAAAKQQKRLATTSRPKNKQSNRQASPHSTTQKTLKTHSQQAKVAQASPVKGNPASTKTSPVAKNRDNTQKTQQSSTEAQQKKTHSSQASAAAPNEASKHKKSDGVR